MLAALRSVSGLALAAAALILPVPPAHAQGVSGGFELLELHVGPGPQHLYVDGTWEAGSGAEHFTLKVSGGSETRTAFDNVQVQTLWMPQLNETVTLALGVRHDIRQGANLTHAAIGGEATLAPWLDAEHYVYISQRGHVTGGAQFVGNLELDKRWRLESRVSLNWSAQSVPVESLASGLTDMSASVRLRHSLGKHADVYVGMAHERLLGGTAQIARDSDSTVHTTRAVVGLGLQL